MNKLNIVANETAHTGVPTHSKDSECCPLQTLIAGIMIYALVKYFTTKNHTVNGHKIT